MADMAEGRKKELKTCGVCGDTALGSNFNAVTCESCKAFFRRNALKPKDFKCPFENKCKVDTITRRFCQKCRLKKCFHIGMKKEWIMTDEEKKAKREKIEKNRRKRGFQQPETSQVSAEDLELVKTESPEPPPFSQTVPSPVAALSPLTPQTPSNMGTLVDTTPKAHLFTHQPLTPSDCEYSPPAKVVILDTVADIYSDVLSSEGRDSDSDSNTVRIPSPNHLVKQALFGTSKGEIDSLKDDKQTGNCDPSEPSTKEVWSTKDSRPRAECNLPDSVYCKAVCIEFAELPIRRTNWDKRELNRLEAAKLQELIVANEILKMPLSCGISDPSLLDVINMTDHAIRRLIKMSKKIKAFKNLCQTDQIALLKGGCTELMILRSVMTYDPEKDCWKGPHGPKQMSIKVDILKEAKGNLYEEHKRFIDSFQPKWRNDENIMLILSCIALFTPDRPNTVYKEVIKFEQDIYYYLLKRYLESIFSPYEAKSVYLRLMHRIEELHILNENHVQVYLDVNPKDVEPLLIEIFDLKH